MRCFFVAHGLVAHDEDLRDAERARAAQHVPDVLLLGHAVHEHAELRARGRRRVGAPGTPCGRGGACCHAACFCRRGVVPADRVLPAAFEDADDA